MIDEQSSASEHDYAQPSGLAVGHIYKFLAIAGERGAIVRKAYSDETAFHVSPPVMTVLIEITDICRYIPVACDICDICDMLSIKLQSYWSRSLPSESSDE